MAALRQALGSRAIIEALETKASGRPTVNSAQMWRYFTTSVYAIGDLPVIATREALQNSIDAIRAAIRARQIGPKDGRFDVVWDRRARTLSWADNGIGMDADTILTKFLSLGDSGKAGAADSTEAAGGFGIAKAVILGVSDSFSWEMRSRDNHAVSPGANSDVTIYASELRQGTAITVSDVSDQYDERWSYARQQDESLLERLRIVLAANDLPEIRISLNGEVVSPLFSRRGGSRIAEGGSWGDGTTATVRAYRRPPGKRGGAFYIRLGGLYQYDRSATGKLPADVVVDLFTAVRPGNKAYPLNAARDTLQAQANWALLDLIREVERENESVGSERDYDVFLPDDPESGEVSINSATQEALTDPELREAMREAAGGLKAYYDELARQPKSLAVPTSQAPAGTRVEAAPPAMPMAGLESLTAQALALGDIAGAVRTVKKLLSDGGELDSERSRALDRAEAGQLSAADLELVEGAIRQASVRAVDQAMQPGSAGLLQASMTEGQIAPLRQLVPTTQPSSPFGRLAGLRISKKNFDRARAYRFRREYGRWLPYLVAWDSTLRLVAAEARLSLGFAPGFILDDAVNGMAALETTSSGTKRAVVYIHPLTFRSVVQAHKLRPLSIAYWLHGLACHELTHLDGRMGDGHSESFVSAREDLGFATAHLLAPLSELVARVLKLGKSTSSPRQRAQRLAAVGLTELEAAMLQDPPSGVDAAYLKRLLERLRPSLLQTLEQLVTQKVRG